MSLVLVLVATGVLSAGFTVTSAAASYCIWDPVAKKNVCYSDPAEYSQQVSNSYNYNPYPNYSNYANRPNYHFPNNKPPTSQLPNYPYFSNYANYPYFSNYANYPYFSNYANYPYYYSNVEMQVEMIGTVSIVQVPCPSNAQCGLQYQFTPDGGSTYYVLSFYSYIRNLDGRAIAMPSTGQHIEVIGTLTLNNLPVCVQQSSNGQTLPCQDPAGVITVQQWSPKS